MNRVVKRLILLAGIIVQPDLSGACELTRA